MTELQSFEFYKYKMSIHQDEEMLSKSELEKSSIQFYQKHLCEFAKNCLFLEHLDFQIYLMNNKKASEASSIQENNSIIFPYFNDIFKNIFYPDLSQIGTDDAKEIIAKSFKDTQLNTAIRKFISNSDKKTDLIKYLNMHPDLDYYFWNVTFPNLFLSFLSTELCEKSIKFLSMFEDDIKTYEKGLVSMINHNYYFRDSFMKTFFIKYQTVTKDSDYKVYIKLSLQKSLKKSIQKLSSKQLEILSKFIENHPKEAQEMFSHKVIIDNVKLWKYSPLFGTFQYSLKKENFELIEFLTNEFSSTEKVQEFLEPVFESIKEKVSINDITVYRLVPYSKHELVLTFLDILIIIKNTEIADLCIQFDLLIKSLDDDNLINQFLRKEAFVYLFVSNFVNKSLQTNVDQPNFDEKLVKKWNECKEEYAKRNISPLKSLYDENEIEKLDKIDPDLKVVAIATIYYDYRAFLETQKTIKTESRALITLRSNIESLEKITEIYTNLFSTKYSLNEKEDDKFIDNLTNLFKTLMKNVMMECITRFFLQYTFHANVLIRKYNECIKNKQFESYDEVVRTRFQNLEDMKNRILSVINEEFTNNFDLYFKDENRAQELFLFFEKLTNFMYKEIINSKNAALGKNPNYINAFENYSDYLDRFTKSFLINHYNNVDTKLVSLNSIENEINLPDSIDKNVFNDFIVSGAFKYLHDLDDYVKNTANNDSIKIGTIFENLPTVIDFCKQFFSNQYSLVFLEAAGIGDDTNVKNEEEEEEDYEERKLDENTDDLKRLLLLVLDFSFTFYTSQTIVPKERIIQFINFLATAFNELESLNDSLPYFKDLADKFNYLNCYLPIHQKNDE